VAGEDYAGQSVASAGDVNNDGFADILVGAPYAGAGHPGAGYVVFGKASGFSSSLALSSLDGDNGFAIPGVENGSITGWSVSSAGDVNHDGYADILIGAPNNAGGGSYRGRTYVIFGEESGFSGSFDLTLLDGSNGFVIDGVADIDLSGGSVSSAGDVNNDGFDDILVGSRYDDSHAGATYVVFGRESGFSGSFDLTLLDGSNGFKIAGAVTGDESAGSVSGAGDVNKDGYADILIGAFSADTGASNGGAAYIVFGKKTGFNPTVRLDDLGADGRAIPGPVVDGGAGSSVSSAGDINHDGYDDMIVGAVETNSEAGAVYVILGKPTEDFPPVDDPIDLSGLDGTNGFTIEGENNPDTGLGLTVSSAGDLNGDGYDDLIVGATFVGKAYVVFGKESGFPDSVVPSALDGSGGFAIHCATADDWLSSVSSAGDVNGDGYDDLIVGCSSADDGDAGAAYVIFGGPSD
jgi:hypothetical protein